MNKSLGIAVFVALCAPSSSALAADYVWATTEAPASRWIEPTTKDMGKVQANQRLELLFREGARLRVRVSGSKFGWIDASVTTEVAPAGAEVAPEGDLPAGGLPTGLPPGLDLQGLKLDAGGNLVIE